LLKKSKTGNYYIYTDVIVIFNCIFLCNYKLLLSLFLITCPVYKLPM